MYKIPDEMNTTERPVHQMDTTDADAAGPPALAGSTAPSKWLRDWMEREGRDYCIYSWDWAEFKRLVWWGLGLTRNARQRAATFRDCIIEGRTARASFTVAAR